MPADSTAANSHDRSKLRLTVATSAQADGERGRAIHNRVNRRPRDQALNFAQSISLLGVIAEGAGS